MYDVREENLLLELSEISHLCSTSQQQCQDLFACLINTGDGRLEGEISPWPLPFL